MKSNIFLDFWHCDKIAKAGLPKNTTFYHGKRDKEIYMARDIFVGITDFDRIYVPAYTDADLNEFLPGRIENKYDLYIKKTKSGFFIEYKNIERFTRVSFKAESEIAVKAKMLLWLIKKKMLKI